jgi:site-specific recombinase XerD
MLAILADCLPLYDIQALLGHERFATTQRYVCLASDAQQGHRVVVTAL